VNPRLGCHGGDPDKIKADYDMRSVEGLFKGGESGTPAIVASKPDQSPLYLSVLRSHDDWEAMPPKARRPSLLLHLYQPHRPIHYRRPPRRFPTRSSRQSRQPPRRLAFTLTGLTDDTGAEAVECVHHVRDHHITLLHLLGLDDHTLTFYHGDRYKQLSQFGGQAITGLLA